MKIVLFAPEIPGNTGSIGRTCVALDLELYLIKPLGFDISEKALRRAGLDYWKHVKLKVFEGWEDFLDREKSHPSQLLFFEKDGSKIFYDAPYEKNSYLIFGRETSGFPAFIYEQYHSQMYYLPMKSSLIRSLNLSNVVTAVAYQGIKNSYSSQ